jgi:hypothetical protein
MKHLLDAPPDGAKHAMDWAALGGAAVVVAGWLPAIASLLSAAWFIMRFYDRVRYGPNIRHD